MSGSKHIRSRGSERMKAPFFRCTVTLGLGPYDDRTLYMRWFNLQHWPELGGLPPPIGSPEITAEIKEYAGRMHAQQQIVIEGQLGKDGRLTPQAVLLGSERYKLVREDGV